MKFYEKPRVSIIKDNIEKGKPWSEARILAQKNRKKDGNN